MRGRILLPRMLRGAARRAAVQGAAAETRRSADANANRADALAEEMTGLQEQLLEAVRELQRTGDAYRAARDRVAELMRAACTARTHEDAPHGTIGGRVG